jgi:Fe-S oxidoreductase
MWCVLCQACCQACWSGWPSLDLLHVGRVSKERTMQSWTSKQPAAGRWAILASRRWVVVAVDLRVSWLHRARV